MIWTFFLAIFLARLVAKLEASTKNCSPLDDLVKYLSALYIGIMTILFNPTIKSKAH